MRYPGAVAAQTYVMRLFLPAGVVVLSRSVAGVGLPGGGQRNAIGRPKGGMSQSGYVRH